jgi:hypothetical protein
MSNRYVVWSNQLVGEETVEVIEVTRSSRNVAEEDTSLIREVLHRKSWVQDTEEK